MKEPKFIQEFREEFAVEDKREDILAVLRARFPGIDLADISTALTVLQDLPQLTSLLPTAATCASPDTFRAALSRQPATV
jgi:hypothetical protein